MMGCGSGCNRGLVGVRVEGKGGDAKARFLAGQAVYIYYFKDICQGALQA